MPPGRQEVWPQSFWVFPSPGFTPGFLALRLFCHPMRLSPLSSWSVWPPQVCRLLISQPHTGMGPLAGPETWPQNPACLAFPVADPSEGRCTPTTISGAATGFGGWQYTHTSHVLSSGVAGTPPFPLKFILMGFLSPPFLNGLRLGGGGRLRKEVSQHQHLLLLCLFYTELLSPRQGSREQATFLMWKEDGINTGRKMY